ncbi:MAG TPA: DUF5915 domain-containing protein, partial [Candidatus Limnocylindria bacterium]|nr:DUF5915 domain-containing protein [Candidatus Limnocylindria bacterium]
PRLGGQTQAVLAAARENAVEFLSDGRVRLAGVELAADEVEIQATPRAGTAVAHDEGLVVIIDTELDDELRAEGDAREVQRAVQELRRQAGFELDELVDVWIDADAGVLARLEPFLEHVADDTLAARIQRSAPANAAASTTVQLTAGEARLAVGGRGSEG